MDWIILTGWVGITSLALFVVVKLEEQRDKAVVQGEIYHSALTKLEAEYERVRMDYVRMYWDVMRLRKQCQDLGVVIDDEVA